MMMGRTLAALAVIGTDHARLAFRVMDFGAAAAAHLSLREPGLIQARLHRPQQLGDLGRNHSVDVDPITHHESAPLFLAAAIIHHPSLQRI
jgi:hypothetical protein